MHALDGYAILVSRTTRESKMKDVNVAGARRKRHFENGGTLVEWRGGLATRVPSGKAYKRKPKHKGE